MDNRKKNKFYTQLLELDYSIVINKSNSFVYKNTIENHNLSLNQLCLNGKANLLSSEIDFKDFIKGVKNKTII